MGEVKPPIIVVDEYVTAWINLISLTLFLALLGYEIYRVVKEVVEAERRRRRGPLRRAIA